MCAPVDKIRNMSAADLLAHCGQEQSVPIDLDAILKKVGISALPMDFSPIERILQANKKSKKESQILGALVMSGNKAAIYYNQNDREDSHRCRFTIAHELAHCCLSHGCANESKPHIDFRFEGKDPISADEREANIFAGALLIPYDALMSVIDSLLVPSVHNLADIFDVSDNVMLARLEHLNIPKPIIGYSYTAKG